MPPGGGGFFLWRLATSHSASRESPAFFFSSLTLCSFAFSCSLALAAAAASAFALASSLALAAAASLAFVSAEVSGGELFFFISLSSLRSSSSLVISRPFCSRRRLSSSAGVVSVGSWVAPRFFFFFVILDAKED
jgi:hypothetical protein